MDVAKIIRRLSGLYQIAEGQAGTPEGDNAGAMFQKLAQKYALDLPENAFEYAEVPFTVEQDYEKDVAQIIAQVVHVSVYELKTGGLRFKGLKIAVEEALFHYNRLRDQLARLTGFTVMGYLMGALGDEVMEGFFNETSEVSKTVRAGIEEAEKRAKTDFWDRMPDENEGELIHAAIARGQEHEVLFWNRIMPKDKVG